MSNLPLVSIVFPTYNTPKEYLDESINSILNQTYRNLELIIINDGSTFDLKEYLQEINDNRIKYIENENNLGVAKTLNKGLSIARGDYIARMDSDDISILNRIELQVEYLESNQDIDILAGRAIYFGAMRRKSKYVKLNKNIKSHLLFGNVLVHPSIMFRSKTLKKYQLEYSINSKAEDYRLWVNCTIQHKDIKFYMLKKSILYYRVHEKQVTSTSKNSINNDKNQVREVFIKQIIDCKNNSDIDIILNILIENPNNKIKVLDAMRAIRNFKVKSNHEKEFNERLMKRKFYLKLVFIFIKKLKLQ